MISSKLSFVLCLSAVFLLATRAEEYKNPEAGEYFEGDIIGIVIIISPPKNPQIKLN